MKSRFSITITVVGILVFVTTLTASVAIGLQYYFSKQHAQERALQNYQTTASVVANEIQQLDRVLSDLTRLVGGIGEPLDHYDESPVTRNTFAGMMANSPLFYSAYIGSADGDFYQLINLESMEGLRAQFDAQLSDRWLLVEVKVEGDQSVKITSYFDGDFQLSSRRKEATDFDVTRRPWFVGASQGKIFKTEPYQFYSLPAYGQTYAIPLANSQRSSVVGVDVVSASLTEKIKNQPALYSDDGVIPNFYMYNEAGVLKAASSNSLPEILLHVSQVSEQHNTLFSVMLGEEEHYVFIQEIKLFEQERAFFAVTIAKDALLDSALDHVVTSTLATAALLALLLPLAKVFAHPIVKPIKEITKQSDHVRLREYDQVIEVKTIITEIEVLSRAVKLTALDLAKYEQQQQEFIESFIKLIAQAIDDKSPYTAGHCHRVPELALLLVDYAERQKSGEFAEFHFENDKQRREFKVAAWLHDCGKITTPEHIVDKGSKLEANYNRIHEIRMRFEVLIRDATIDYYKQQLENHADKVALDERLEKRIQQIVSDFEFIAKSNVGGEFMDEEAITRVQHIANQTWTRHLSDRIGLSPAEEIHLNQFEATDSLPVTEFLLADKPEHRFEHPTPIEFPAEFEIKMAVPDLLANQGEVYNLCVSRGTLTAEDRFKINEHIISTIKMLEQMPFPPELAKVPRYASTHHETMKGTGYPRQLNGDQLTIPERILVLADIFEALTAQDRPYKKAKSLSRSLDILHKMALDDHIDKSVFRLFIESGVYLEYAKRYLKASQIDEVDTSKLKV